MIIFVRHWQTQDNVDKIVQTYTDNPILPLPMDVFRTWSRNVPLEFSPDHTWVSPLIRTQQTAEALVGKYDWISAYLTEMPLQDNEGTPCLTDGTPFNYTPQLLNDLDQTKSNVVKFWDALDKTENHLIFCHGITMRLFYYYIKGLNLPDHFPDIFNIKIAPLTMMVIDGPDIEFIHSATDNLEYKRIK